MPVCCLSLYPGPGHTLLGSIPRCIPRGTPRCWDPYLAVLLHSAAEALVGQDVGGLELDVHDGQDLHHLGAEATLNSNRDKAACKIDNQTGGSAAHQSTRDYQIPLI